ncbi:hypothetical protein G6F24_015680 [Rhizopus arrhizus]|nr:hypothetical protein G6F24_015680 [Rhizopus arrhizus]
MAGLGHGFQRAHRERETGEVALADGRRATVVAAVCDFAAIGGVLPAGARGHHVAMGIERDAAAGAVLAPHDQVGDGFQAVVLHRVRRYRMRFGVKAKVLQQFSGARRVRRIVAGRRVGGDAHERLQEADFLVKVGINPGVQAVVVGHFESEESLARSSSRRCMANAASWMSSLVVDSRGLWLMPAFWPRTNSMACGMTSCSFIASWPAPLGMR